MTQILKSLNFQQLLKRILRASSFLGGAIAILWVRPLYFSALQISDEEYVKLKCMQLLTEAFDTDPLKCIT